MNEKLNISMMIVGFALVSCGGCQKQPSQLVEKSQQGSGTPVDSTDSSQKLSRFTFQNRSPGSGLNFVYRNGEESGHFSILESLGGGVAILDFDKDGKEDLCFAGGGRFGAEQEIKGYSTGLFRNLGSFEFVNASTPSKITYPTCYSHSVARADFDSDGFPDFLVTGYERVLFFHNQGDGTFTETSFERGLQGVQWGSSAAWGDFNRDGFLDLFIAQYVDWSFENHPFCPAPDGKQRDVCPPRSFHGLQDLLYFSNGDGTFRSPDPQLQNALRAGKGLGVVTADFDLDGDLDVYITNDTEPNCLYENGGAGEFSERALMSGTAVNAQGTAEGSMGVETLDYNLDGLLDLWVVNYENESASLYRNEGNLLFRHVSSATGVSDTGGLFVGWGTCSFDADKDGDEDIFVSNGHVIRFPTKAPLRQVPLFFSNQGGQKFVDVASYSGPYFSSPHQGRGAATSDLDHDGDIDLVVSHVNEPVTVLDNQADQTLHWIEIELHGSLSSRDAIGSIVSVSTSSGDQIQHFSGGGSYASTNSRRLFFGLGDDDRISKIQVQWPSGQTELIEGSPVDKTLQITEQKGTWVLPTNESH